MPTSSIVIFNNLQNRSRLFTAESLAKMIDAGIDKE
jgi:hypothetical protein